MVKIGNVELQGNLTLGPMAGVTDAAFRLLCRKHGVVEADGCCRRFVYDPLKREPAHAVQLPSMEYVEL